MSERIDEIQYTTPSGDSTKEPFETFFLTGPGEFLCLEIARLLKADTVWAKLFGDAIDGYKRMDYAMRNLPAMRIYNDEYKKEYESWWITGSVKIDLIFPANIRRNETQQIPDTVSAALVQQFRRPSFFQAVCATVPGLNELGKTVYCDKALAFEWQEDMLVPLVQCVLNFRLDLRAWDDYMESDYRTKDEPFDRPLGDLEQIATYIQALRDDGEVELTILSEQTTTDDDEP